MRLSFERAYPYVFGVAAGAAWMYYKVPFAADAKELLAAALSMASILTGFLATAKAILISVNDSSVIRDLQRSGHHSVLIGYLSESIIWLFAFSIWNLVGFFMVRGDFYCVAWVTLGTLSAFSFVRVVYALMLVLKHVAPSSPGNGAPVR